MTQRSHPQGDTTCREQDGRIHLDINMDQRKNLVCEVIKEFPYPVDIGLVHMVVTHYKGYPGYKKEDLRTAADNACRIGDQRLQKHRIDGHWLYSYVPEDIQDLRKKISGYSPEYRQIIFGDLFQN